MAMSDAAKETMLWNASAAIVNFASYSRYICTWKSAVHQNLYLSGQGDQQNKTSNTNLKLLVTLGHNRKQCYLNSQGDKTKQNSEESQIMIPQFTQKSNGTSFVIKWARVHLYQHKQLMKLKNNPTVPPKKE